MNQVTPFPPSSRLAAYLRDSGGEEQELSIPQQENAVRAWCADHHYTLTRIFKDEARPGSSTIGRDGFQEMIAHFRSPTCQEAGIIVWKYSRFTRDIDDAQFYRADLRKRGYEIHSLNDNVPQGLDGRFFEAAIDWMNQRFLDDLSTDTRRGLRHLVETYRAVPGVPPRGFIRQPVDAGKRRDGSPHVVHRWDPDPDMTPIIRRAFELRASGSTYKEIQDATHLYRSKNCYPTFFSNRLYIGELVFGDLVIEDYCEPIIDRATWNQVQTIQQAHSEARARKQMSPPNQHPRQVSSPYLLSGLLHCARCGSPMSGHLVVKRIRGERKSWSYYFCNRRNRRYDCSALEIPRETIEKAVLTELCNHILQPENLAAIQHELQQQNADLHRNAEAERSSIAKRMTSLRKKIDNLVTGIADLGYSPALGERLRGLETDHARLQADLDQVEHQLSNPSPDLTPTQIGELSNNLAAMLDTGDQVELKKILRLYIQKVAVERDGRILRGIIHYYNPLENQIIDSCSYVYDKCPQRGTVLTHNFTAIIPQRRAKCR